jgi:RNA polymerase sigma-70 factor, ECF subfamily
MSESIRSLYDLYANDVYRFAKLTLGDAEEAKDVTQEVFYRAFRSMNRFRGESNPRTWIMSIARNYIFDLFRRRRIQQKAWAEYRLGQDTSVVDYPEEMHLLEDAILELKPTYRQVFVLRHVQNYSVQETATILHWSTSKVTTTDQRAIEKLRSILGGERSYGETK